MSIVFNQIIQRVVSPSTPGTLKDEFQDLALKILPENARGRLQDVIYWIMELKEELEVPADKRNG